MNTKKIISNFQAEINYLIEREPSYKVFAFNIEAIIKRYAREISTNEIINALTRNKR